MTKVKSLKSYSLLKDELDGILLDLQREDISIDSALKQYQRGLQLTQAINDYLAEADNKVTELKSVFNNKGF